jgi:hypothetical protein
MILLITLALAGLVGWLMLTYVVQTEQDPSSPIGAPAPAAVGHPLVTR